MVSGGPICKSGWACVLAALAGLLGFAGAGCAPTSFLVTPVPATKELEEHVVLRESLLAVKKVALIDVDGVLRNAREPLLTGVPGENPVSLFKEKLDRAAKDHRVKAVILRVNSPGGTVTASDLMHAELRDFRLRAKKPVVASLLDVGASGGYYLACGADRIYALPTTLTGGIGVVLLLPEFTGTMDKLGIRVRIFKSGELKDAGSMFREMSPREQELFRDLVSQMYARFVSVVQEARKNLTAEQIAELSDGRVFTGPEAKERGLVDEIGGLSEALQAAKQAAGLADEKVLVVEYARPFGHRPNMYARSDVAPAQVNLVNIALPDWLRSPAPELMYLWAPGW